MREYLDSLNRICDDVERIYGLDRIVNGKKLSDLDVRELFPIINKYIVDVGEDKIGDVGYQAFPYISLLCHLKDRIKFFGYEQMNFSNFPNRNELEMVLGLFTDKSLLNRNSVKKVNTVIKILNDVDTKRVELRFGIEYRLLRLFCVMVAFRSYADASSVAQLLLTQIGVG